MRNFCLALLMGGVVGVQGCAGGDDDNNGPGGCEPGETRCDLAGGSFTCSDLDTDSRNCGACGTSCGDFDCVGGYCAGGDSDADTDSDSDVDVDSDVDGDCDDNCIDVADPGIPVCSDIGASCRDNRDCELGFFCVPDANGWPDGYCLAGGPVGGGACDPNLPASCPDGSTCIYNGQDADGIQYYYCFKDCNISDRNPWDVSACGCRDGYECDLLNQFCVPGCTTANLEDDCCQYWSDPNGDFVNDGAAEFDVVPDCSLTCNEDAYRCVNPGSPDANWGDGCLYTQDCPEEGGCLRERDEDGVPGGDHFFIGGYCARWGCDLDGRGCEINGGPDSTADNCRNLGSTDDPAWLCVKTCNITNAEGGDKFATNVDCGANYNCFPDESDPIAEKNGFCWTPPRLNDVRTPNMGGPCADDSECYSPYGQGFCLEEQGGSGWLEGSCGLGACDFPGMEGECAEPDYICESFGGFGICLDRCTDPGGGFGTAAGCRDDNYACYTSGAGGADGVCLPNCNAQPDPDAFCGDFFRGAPNCNAVTGICEP